MGNQFLVGPIVGLLLSARQDESPNIVFVLLVDIDINVLMVFISKLSLKLFPEMQSCKGRRILDLQIGGHLPLSHVGLNLRMFV